MKRGFTAFKTRPNVSLKAVNPLFIHHSLLHVQPTGSFIHSMVHGSRGASSSQPTVTDRREGSSTSARHGKPGRGGRAFPTVSYGQDSEDEDGCSMMGEMLIP